MATCHATPRIEIFTVFIIVDDNYLMNPTERLHV